MVEKNLIGLDIGSKLTKIVKVRHKSGVKFLTNAYLIETPSSLDMQDISSFSEFLSNIAIQYKLKGSNIAYALNIAEAIARYITLPLVDEAEIEQAIMWEAEQYIPFKLDKVNVNYQILNIDQKNKEIKALIVAAKREKIEFLKDAFSRAKLNLKCLDVDVFATMNAFLENSSEKNKLNFILNVGAKSTKIALLYANEPIYSSHIDFNLDNIVNDIAQKLSISDTESLQLILSKQKDHQVVTLIDNNLVNLHSELSNVLSFNFSILANKNIENFVLAGGGCAIEEIGAYLETIFAKKVLKLNPFETLTIEDANFDINNKFLFDVALGLALRKV